MALPAQAILKADDIFASLNPEHPDTLRARSAREALKALNHAERKAA